jgi:hypothetical protein
MSEQPKPNNSSSLNQLVEKVQPTLQKAWVGSRPTIAQLLKATIGTLQKAVDGLETQMQTEGSTTQPLWVKIMGLVRDRLPEDISLKLNDRALSGILAGTMLLLLWITTHLPGSAATPKPVASRPIASRPVATRPPVQPVVPQRPITTAPLTQPNPIAQQFPVDVGQTANTPFPKDLSAPGSQPQTAPQTSSTAPQPSQTAPISPASPAATAIATAPVQPKPIPPKPVKLTPEQKLLAKIQESTNVYGSDLAQSVKADKVSRNLKVTLAPAWYDLNSEQQDQLSASLLNQAQTLKFKSLELQDAEANLLARSPIVGNEMVILLRQHS